MDTETHVRFIEGLEAHSHQLPFLQMAHIKMSALYWAITAAHLLGRQDRLFPPERLNDTVRFLKACWRPTGGFAGNEGAHDAHLLFTLSALQIIKMLQTVPALNLAWFNPETTASYVLSLQREDGAFVGDEFGEVDTRFTYCAVASLSLLGRLHLLDRERTVAFVMRCRNFDGGYGAIPGAESHGGNVFCCVSLLKLLDALHLVDREALVEWLVWRQLPSGGLNGRPEKLADVCYSWWILSALKSLDALHLISRERLVHFVLQCQDPQGGFADRPGDMGDIFHTLFGLAGLAFMEHPGVGAIDAVYCLPEAVLIAANKV